MDNKKIDDLLKKLCHWSKHNCNGGGVFDEDVNKMVPIIREKIIQIVKEAKND